MPVEVSNLNELDSELVAANFALMTQLVAEKFPTVDLKRGVIHDVILYLSGVLDTVPQQNILRQQRSASLQAIEDDPTLADDDLVDKVVSNYRLDRLEASLATGVVTIILDSLFPVNIPVSAVFSANGEQFQTEVAYSVRTSSSNVTSATDRVLQAVGDGTFAFQIDVVAVDAGIVGVRRGTMVEMTTPPPRFVRAYAESDFIDGIEAETNEQLMTKLQEGIAAKAYSNRTNVSALIHEQTDFESVLGISIVGFGDAEMLRDQHSIFPGSFGGRSDVYAKTQRLYQSLTLQKEATLIEKRTDGTGVWQFSIVKADAPGFYEVELILPTTAPEDQDSGYEVTSDIRGLDLSGDELIPDVETSAEGAYSAYQTAVIQFWDSDTNTADLTEGISKETYKVVVRVLPAIADIQTFLGQRGTCNPGGDILVRAAVPCFLNLNFTIRQKPGADTPATSDIANLLATTVNSLTFPSVLHASQLIDAIQEVLPENSWITDMDMFGRIRRPDGTTGYIRDAEKLEIPYDPERFVTGRTTTFYLDPNDVGITVTASPILEI